MRTSSNHCAENEAEPLQLLLLLLLVVTVGRSKLTGLRTYFELPRTRRCVDVAVVFPLSHNISLTDYTGQNCVPLQTHHQTFYILSAH